MLLLPGPAKSVTASRACNVPLPWHRQKYFTSEGDVDLADGEKQLT